MNETLEISVFPLFKDMSVKLGLLLYLCCAGAVLVCTGSLADDPIEVIELKSRPLDEILPVIRPFAGPGGSVTGMGNSLVIKTSPERLREIRRLLAELDRPPRRLLITVGNQGDSADSSRGYTARADIRIGDGQVGINTRGHPADRTRARIDIQDSSTQRTQSSQQWVQALEGRPAYISSGVQLPRHGMQRYYRNGVLHEHRTTVLQDVSSGFYVVPRVNGEFVTLDILQHDDRPGQYRGTVSTQRVATVVRGRLGEWLDLGAIDTVASDTRGGIGRSAVSRGSNSRQIQVRVECLDCRP
jgi:hypothetical protein